MTNQMQTSEEIDEHTDQCHRILIVDDDEASCRTLQLHLRSQGYDVALANSVDGGAQGYSSIYPGSDYS